MANDSKHRMPRRKILKTLAGTGAAVSLAGCSSGDSTNSSGGGSGGGSQTLLTKDRIGVADAPMQMTHWVLPNSSHTGSENPKLAGVYEDFFNSYAKNHPDVRINLEYQTNLEQMKTKLLQVTAAGNGPEMSQVDSFWVPNFKDDLQPVTSAIENPDDWYPFVKDIVVQGGEWKAVWKNTDCRALYYRQDMIDKYNSGNPPTTWDELISVGKDIVANEDMNGYMYNGGKWEGTTFDNLAMFWAQGGNLVDDKGAPVLDQPKNKQALLNVFKFFERTVDSGVTPQRIVNINDYSLLREAALNDETAMFLGGNWQISTIKQQVSSKEEWKNWKVAKIPQMEAGTAATGTGGWTVGTFAKDKTKHAATVDFAGMYADKENMGKYCKAGGYLPTRKSVFEDVEYFAQDPYMQVYKKLLENGRARPGVPIYLTISSQWQVATGKVLTGQASPEEAVNTMIKNVNQEYSG